MSDALGRITSNSCFVAMRYSQSPKISSGMNRGEMVVDDLRRERLRAGHGESLIRC